MQARPELLLTLDRTALQSKKNCQKCNSECVSDDVVEKALDQTKNKFIGQVEILDRDLNRSPSESRITSTTEDSDNYNRHSTGQNSMSKASTFAIGYGDVSSKDNDDKWIEGLLWCFRKCLCIGNVNGEE
ncbi:unnamed protein product [Hermetia illucens]|uniref:Uncharacterized protein n=1 Tax=Hermetia illucens TaxID=343691 RepID=A0A7R8UP92_HERIL|nr:unnamed protein product [Hermetia illucens]